MLRKKGHLPISPKSFLDPLTTHSDLRQLEAELVDFLIQGFPILRKVELPVAEPEKNHEKWLEYD